MARRSRIAVTDAELRKFRTQCPVPSCKGYAAQMVLSRTSWKECTDCRHQWRFRDASSKPITREQKDELVKPRAGVRGAGESEERRVVARRREQYKQEVSEMTKSKKAAGQKGKKKSKAVKKPAARRIGTKIDGARDSRIPKVGILLKGKYKGKEYVAKVTADGFEFDGKSFSSISKIGSVIMGGKACNGYKFFGLC